MNDDTIKHYARIGDTRDIVARLLRDNEIPFNEAMVEVLVDYVLNLQKEIASCSSHEDQLQYLIKIIVCNAAVLLNQPKPK
jgi:hypothetical protein